MPRKGGKISGLSRRDWGRRPLGREAGRVEDRIRHQEVVGRSLIGLIRHGGRCYNDDFSGLLGREMRAAGAGVAGDGDALGVIAAGRIGEIVEKRQPQGRETK